jgi:putative ABC transport system permease protein
MPQIRGGDQKAVSPELAARALLDGSMTRSGNEEAIVLRGVEPAAYEVHGAKLVAGRMPAAGATELLAGVQARTRYPALALGSVVKLPHEDWTVVGFFSAGGSTYEGELWADRARVSKPLKNEGVNSLAIAAATSADAAALIEKVNSTKAFKATARLEREYRGSQADLARVTKLVALLVLIMCLVGVFVTATNLHASLVTRMPEFASLIVLGVRRRQIAGLVLMESLTLSIAGAVLAILLVLLAQGRSAAALSSAAAFDLHVGLIPTAFGITLAIVIGLIGGLFPSYLAKRMDLLRGLR